MRIITCALMAALLASCSLLGDSKTVERFTVRVDSVAVPEQVGAMDTLAVELLGQLGPNGCYGLQRIKAERRSSALHLTVIGRVVRGEDVVCTDALVPLHATYKAAPPLEGPFQVTIHQPGGEVIQRTVQVQQQN